MNVARTAARRKSSLRRSAVSVGGTAVAMMALIVAVPAAATAAAPDTVTAHNHVSHPQLDWLGSTVAQHEGGAQAAPASVTPNVTQTPGMDVSSFQGSVNWASAWANGGKFAYVKATESTTYTNPDFAQQYNGSYNVGMIRGAYHFATPDTSGGATQADYFVAHGGGWSKDGKTLPPMLDIEYNPYGAECYGLSHAAMVSWITSFVNEIHAKTTRWATIYSTTDWWTTCTGNSGAFGANDPLFIANYNGTPDPLPAGWGFYTFWQYADSGTFPGDQDYFNGPLSGLQNLANNT